MRIAIDLDDTQSEFCSHWISIYNAIFEDNLKPSDVLDWEIEKYCNKCSKNELYEILGRNNFFKHTEPVKYARDVIAKLRSMGHEVFTVTAYHPNACIDKSWWLKEYMGFTQDDIIFCNKKHLIRADMLLDDGAHNHANFEGLKIVYDRPHNQHMREFEYDCRVNSWKDFEVYCQLTGIL